MPDIYEANSRVYVDASSQLREILGDQIIAPDLSAQLNYVRESLLGQSQLEAVVRQAGLAAGIQQSQEMDRLLEDVRSRVLVSISGGARGSAINNAYGLSFRYPERQAALDVVQALLNSFVEDTLSNRREGSESARRFLEEQLREYEERLTAAEERLASFRREHSDVLPGSEGGYFERLQAETAALDEVTRALELAESRRDRMLDQLSGGPAASSAGPTEPLPNSLDARIRDHEARLEELLLRFTDRHPDIRGLRDTLERLREQQATQIAARESGHEPAAASDDPVYQQLQISLNNIEVEIASLQVEAERRRARVGGLRARMDDLPEVEAQLARLNRDYDVVNARYQSLLRSLETERMTRQASETDQIEFRVIDPPTVSSEPVEPNRPVLLIGVLVAGLGGGGALAFLLAQLRPVFSTPRALREITGLPVLGAVSLTWQERHRVRRRMSIISFAFGCAALFSVFVALFLVEVAGPGLLALTA